MNVKMIIFLLFASSVVLSCGKKNPEKPLPYENPSEEGFDLTHSDPAAVELADSVMSAMGGRKAWDQTRFISWTSSDARNILWDKELDRIRIESTMDSAIYLFSAKTLEGKVKIKGQELTTPDSIKKKLTLAKDMWTNDSYWLLMPFKLKGSGVTLKYLGEDTLQTGARCNVLELTFAPKENTPSPKYHISIDIKDNLVKQWAYFSDAKKEEQDWVRPWDNYKQYGKIMLSADRSNNNGPKNVKIDETVDDKLFQEF